jgi:hypothetical protein
VLTRDEDGENSEARVKMGGLVCGEGVNEIGGRRQLKPAERCHGPEQIHR